MVELAVVMPVYNEEEAIEAVAQKWIDLFRKEDIRFELHIYNDGSRDGSGTILDQLSEKYKELKVHHKSNSGHGPTILQGYRENVKADWIFQIDSDDELGTTGFSALWENRSHFDLLIGMRTGRKAPLARKVITFITGLTVRIFYGKGVNDVNCPFRLMRSAVYKALYSKIPETTFAPNVLISGFAGQHQLRIFQTSIVHNFRQTGEVSIKHWKLLRAAILSFWQTIKFRFHA